MACSQCLSSSTLLCCCRGGSARGLAFAFTSPASAPPVRTAVPSTRTHRARLLTHNFYVYLLLPWLSDSQGRPVLCRGVAFLDVFSFLTRAELHELGYFPPAPASCSLYGRAFSCPESPSPVLQRTFGADAMTKARCSSHNGRRGTVKVDVALLPILKIAEHPPVPEPDVCEGNPWQFVRQCSLDKRQRAWKQWGRY